VSLVDVQGVQLQFGKNLILTDVHLSVHQREIVTIIGPNGAGKSTLLKVILGLVRPNKGSIVRKPKIKMGYMPQNWNIEPFIPLPVNRFLQLAGSVRPSELQKVTSLLQIEHLEPSPMQSLSGGELQRVLLARALIRKPDLLVLDEPVQGVDLTGQEELYQLILEIRDSYNCGIIMVSHDLHLVMAGTDSVICLNKHVCCAGHPSIVGQNPEFLKLFGIQGTTSFAVYTHHHSHRHLGGDKCP
jgi:zinc transport system ATP-binding protein